MVFEQEEGRGKEDLKSREKVRVGYHLKTRERGKEVQSIHGEKETRQRERRCEGDSRRDCSRFTNRENFRSIL